MADAFDAGDVDTAGRIHRDLAPLIAALFATSNPIPVKWAMGRYGFAGRPVPLAARCDARRAHDGARTADRAVPAIVGSHTVNPSRSGSARSAASFDVLGCRVDAVGRDEAVSRIAALANSGRPGLVVTLGVEMVMDGPARPRISPRRERCRARHLRYDRPAAGRRACAAVRCTNRVTGVELVDALAARSASLGDVRLYLLGGAGDTAQRAADALRRTYPDAIVVGARNGYFRSRRRGRDRRGDSCQRRERAARRVGFASPRALAGGQSGRQRRRRGDRHRRLARHLRRQRRARAGVLSANRFGVGVSPGEGAAALAATTRAAALRGRRARRALTRATGETRRPHESDDSGGGMSTRLYPLTSKSPSDRGRLPANRSAGHVMRGCRRTATDEVAINVFYLADLVERTFGGAVRTREAPLSARARADGEARAASSRWRAGSTELSSWSLRRPHRCRSHPRSCVFTKRAVRSRDSD